MNDLKKRILEISFKHKLSHIGSCLTAVDIIDEIYQTKKLDEKFVLSAGHAGLALYCVIEKYEGIDAEKIWKHHGTHPDRCEDCHIDCSTGSLGQGLPIAVGMALADKSKNVYCLISDGECAEGSIFESVRIRYENNLDNLKIYLNANGYGGYGETDCAFDLWIKVYSLSKDKTMKNLQWVDTIVEQLPFLKGQDAHYYVMKEGDYKQAMEILK